MITVATFSKPEEAHLFRLRLEAAGISAFLRDENVIQAYWLFSNALGGVRVDIAKDDLEAARSFLAEDSPQPSPDAVGVGCPSCGSQETAPDELPRRLVFLGMLLGYLPLLFIPLLIRHRHWVCASCAHVFRVAPSGGPHGSHAEDSSGGVAE